MNAMQRRNLCETNLNLSSYDISAEGICPGYDSKPFDAEALALDI